MAIESKSVPFTIMNAFTDNIAGGNPAAIVFISSLSAYPDEVLLTIARNFNQPITTFVSPGPVPIPNDAEIAEFGARWFTPDVEVPICGHGSLAAAKAIFTHGSLVPASVNTLRFESDKGRVAVARRVEDDRIEIALDAASLTELSNEDDATKLRAALERAVGKDVKVKFMGRGDAKYPQYVLVELDVPDLGALKVDTQALLDSPFSVHVLTTSPTTGPPDVAFHSRMFAPAAGIPEDQVCGTAHCLLAPYWKAKKQLSGAIMAKQVSPRGGDLRVVVDETDGLVRLAGHVKIVSKGELFL